ncbi:thiopeptide-type bacteriocin biosynthesis protein [Mucilaginibacter gracilis]|uniref:Thiopeptide-type bacteriocin biosynthesis protein n=1 Tax=Mucilaginibacter gracilis TaxID=423350 RepID=A0A495J6K4_9SPHI|nr:lantibiotic dehydratase [Mucilaginibacter gracilis]RKR84626.1 thiopeptide-type bacteriocin biosynthesis protein [Mucilaginibacter gracilis]
MVRAPFFSYIDYTQVKLDKIIGDPYFQEALFLASPGLYHNLEEKQFDNARLSEREKLSVQKYFNRMCFRPTPFGAFSSFSVTTWGKDETIILKNEDAKLHLNVDQEIVNRLSPLFVNDDPEQNLFIANPALYQWGRDFRFITTTYANDSRKIYFDLESIEINELTGPLFSFCRTVFKSGKEIAAYMMDLTGCTMEMASDYLRFLIGAGILMSATNNNIIGKDYLQVLSAQSNSPSLLNTVLVDINRNRELIRFPDVQYLKTNAERISQLLSGFGHQHPGPLFYAGLERSTTHGALSSKIKDQLMDGVMALSALVAPAQPDMFRQFIKDFKARYNRQKIPLLQAVDPDIGIGYGPVNHANIDSDLLRSVKFRERKTDQLTLDWSKVHRMLFKKWNDRLGNDSPIVLDELDVQSLSSNSTLSSPPSIAALFRTTAHGVFLESLGGVTATALIGRFTAWNKEIHRVSKEIAAVEQAANPEIIFADIGQLSDPHADNINRREHVYHYEIPINVISTLDNDHQIQLSDLWVSVVDDELVLESERHQKVIIPRLTSAYNYTRNNLAVFRLLCDLQQQGLQGSYAFSLAHYFPGMAYYPRVVYKRTILSPATWYLSVQDLKDLQHLSGDESVIKIRSLKDQLKLPTILALSKFDQQLVFNLDNDWEILFLVDCLKGSEGAVLQEFFIPDNRTIQTGEGKALCNQFVAFLYKREAVYSGLQLRKDVAVLKKQQDYIIGSKWLYLKLYCNPAMANNILSTRLLPLLKKLDQSEMQSWFFIRYRDPGYHIRLRLKIKETAVGPILDKFKRRMSETISYQLIREYQADTYRREMERYGGDIIEWMEDYFHGSSELIAHHIKMVGKKTYSYSYHSIAFVSVYELLERFIPDIVERISFLEKMVELFYAEFATDKSLRIDLDQKYRELKIEVSSLVTNESYYHQLRLTPYAELFRNGIKNVLRHTTAFGVKRKNQLLADMIHMHLNRLFVDKQRQQELIVYYCLLKFQVTVRAMSSVKSKPPA